MRPTIDLELQPLLKALRSRLEPFTGVVMDLRDGVEIHQRNTFVFLALDIRRDHLILDLWLPTVKLDEARASGIARAHPFMETEAVRVRFERAEDLTKVAHWLEEAYRHVPVRAKRQARQAAATAKAEEKKSSPPKPKGAKRPARSKSTASRRPAAKKKAQKSRR